MFAVFCTVEGTTVLRWTRHIESVLHPSPGAVDLIVRCVCGEQVLIRTGRARDRDEAVHGSTREAALTVLSA